MKKIFFIILTIGSSLFSSIEAKILIKDFYFPNLNHFIWQKVISFDMTPFNRVGYFYLGSWYYQFGIYASYREIEENDADRFYESLKPFEENLFPYTTPNWITYTNYTILAERSCIINDSPAKLMIVSFDLPEPKNYFEGEKEIAIIYLMTREKVGIFSNSFHGYTVSFSFSSKSEIGEIFSTINQMIIN